MEGGRGGAGGVGGPQAACQNSSPKWVPPIARMTIVKKHDSIQGGREGGIPKTLRFSAHLIVFVLQRTALQIRFSAGQFDFILILI